MACRSSDAQPFPVIPQTYVRLAEPLISISPCIRVAEGLAFLVKTGTRSLPTVTRNHGYTSPASDTLKFKQTKGMRLSDYACRSNDVPGGPKSQDALLGELTQLVCQFLFNASEVETGLALFSLVQFRRDLTCQ
jgi:hypothetical protein